MPINKNELTQEMIKKAMQCKDADELVALAKAEGKEITKEEAEAYLAEMDDCELDGEILQKVAGGGCYSENNFEPCNNFQVA
jgi:hypothetical protein